MLSPMRSPFVIEEGRKRSNSSKFCGLLQVCCSPPADKDPLSIPTVFIAFGNPPFSPQTAISSSPSFPPCSLFHQNIFPKLKTSNENNAIPLAHRPQALPPQMPTMLRSVFALFLANLCEPARNGNAFAKECETHSRRPRVESPILTA